VAGHLKRISSNQVRNVGSWTGNLMIAYEYPNFASDGILALAGVCPLSAALIGSVHTFLVGLMCAI
jgi:hypothetical protein